MLKNIINRFMEKLLDIIFPKVCIRCGKQESSYICSSCLPFFYSKVKILKINNKFYDYLIYVNKYKDEMRTKLLGFKFYDKSYYADFFINLLLTDKKINSFLKKFDIIIPVPMNKSKKVSRGYNQAELLARSLCKQFEKLNKYKDKILYNTEILKKKRENRTQSLLNKFERIKNVENVFYIEHKEKIIGKNIILLDDIFTTGATANECSKILKNNGAKSICVIVIFKA